MSNLNHSYNIASINTNAISNNTKIQSLRTFIRSVDLDIVLLQEVENPYLAIPGFNVITNVDNQKRGTAIALKSHMSFSNVQRSIDSRVISVTLDGGVKIVNVYAPSGTANYASRENFFQNILPFYLQSTSEHLVLGGDFNCVVSHKDSTGSSNFSPALGTLLSNLNLKDTWDLLKPNQIQYSFIRPNCASRIDRLYITESLVAQLRTAEFYVTSFSDHKPYKIRCCLPNQGRSCGNGYWSIRAHVLTEDNMQEFEIKWNRWLRERRNYNSWISWWVAFAKPKIRSFFRWKTNETFRRFHAENEMLYRQLRIAYDNLYQNPRGTAEINKIKGKMLLLQNHFSQTFERLNDKIISGEKLSTFQLADRARRKKNSTITEISHNGRVLRNAAEIEGHVFNYFNQLYTAQNHEPNTNFPSNRTIDINCEANNHAMNEITTEEIFFSIQSAAAKKSPGSDGIPKEFYVKAFDIIHRQLNLILNEAIQGNLPPEFLEGVIVLCKKNSDHSSIKSFRPITLLNCDYKLLARILKARLEKIMINNHVLNENQKCSNNGKNIFEAVLGIKDKIVELNCKRKTGRLISFDLDHAFDRVDQRYLLNVMREIRFNDDLIGLLERIMQNSCSRLLINGHLSQSFPVQRSIRQGDPLSMHLFVIYLHPLIEKLQTICDNRLELVVAYADDISIIIVDDRKVETIRRTFEDFGVCAGAVLNLNKTIAVNIGINSDGYNNYGWLNVNDSVKILGITFFNSLKKTIEHNWTEVVRSTSRLMWLYKPRILSLLQKVILLNTFITARLWFVASILSVPNAILARMTSQIGYFIWGRYPTRVALDQLTLPIDKGGLNLHLPMQKCKALLVNRFLQCEQNLPFAHSFHQFLSNPPHIQAIPALYPCLKVIAKEVPYLSEYTIEHLSAKELHKYYKAKLTSPKVVTDNNTVSWKRVWSNIRNKTLSSEEKSLFYLFVNGKIPHATLLFRQNRLQSPICQNCRSANEDLEHKFALCSRIRHLWNHVLPKLETITGRRHRYKDFSLPELKNINISAKNKALKLFIVYIKFILDAENLTIDALDFMLDYMLL